MFDKIIEYEDYIYSFNSYEEAILFLSYYILEKRTEVILEMISDINIRLNGSEI